MEKKSSKWLRHIFVLMMILLFCVYFIYGCGTAFTFIGDKVKQFQSLIKDIDQVDPSTLYTTAASEYTIVYEQLQPEYAELFLDSGDINRYVVLQKELTLTYADFASILNNLIQEKEKYLSLQSFEVRNNQIQMVFRLNIDLAKEKYEQLELFSLSTMYLISQCSYQIKEDTILLASGEFWIGGLEKEGEKMQFLKTYFADLLQQCQSLVQNIATECMQVFLHAHTIAFLDKVVITPKEEL